MLVSTSVYGDYQMYMSSLIRQFYNKLDWEEKPLNDTWMERQLRTNVVSFSCLRGVPECINKAKNYFNNWMNQPSTNP